MAKRQTYACDNCGTIINDDEGRDFLSYLVAGNVNGRTVDITAAPLPDGVKLLLAQRVARLELCVGCMNEHVQLSPTIKGKLLGRIIRTRREEASRRARGGEEERASAAAQVETDLRALYPDVEPEDPGPETWW